MEWDPRQYLHFGDQRTRVVRDLVARLQLHLAPSQVHCIVDLGCGPGNSTAVLAEAWPNAQVTGLDASENMLQSARAAHPQLHFECADITTWASSTAGTYDLVFSNSALQWVDDHATLLPKLLARVAPGGALAFQIPAGSNAPACVIPRTLAASAAWRDIFAGASIREWHTEPIARYHDILAPHAAAQREGRARADGASGPPERQVGVNDAVRRLLAQPRQDPRQSMDLWDTEYVVIHPNHASILDWYRGSGLRIYLQALPDGATRTRFEQAYLAAIRAAYPPQPNGSILFPFLRRFLVARN